MVGRGLEGLRTKFYVKISEPPSADDICFESHVMRTKARQPRNAPRRMQPTSKRARRSSVTSRSLRP